MKIVDDSHREEYDSSDSEEEDEESLVRLSLVLWYTKNVYEL